jgi:hypothetical protein
MDKPKNDFLCKKRLEDTDLNQKNFNQILFNKKNNVNIKESDKNKMYLHFYLKN